MEHIVIIGNGVSGVAVARHLRKMSNHKITIISAETAYHYSRTALMYIYMGHMKFEHTQPYEKDFWKKNNIHLKQAFVDQINFDAKELNFESGERMSYDKLVLAVGSKPNKFGWPGQDLEAVGGLYSYQDLERMEQYSDSTKRAVIVGGGLIGLEMAEMFLSRGIDVTFLVREKAYWANVLPKGEAAIVTKHIQDHHIDLRLSTELKEILPDADGRVKSILTADGEEIECQFVGLTAGVSPNIDFLRSQDKLELDRGILVNEYLETNLTDVYAVGDCVQHKRPPIGRRSLEQVWYTGKIMGESLANSICKKEKYKYEPGLWFNSAKFIDIEYQTYGWVFPQLQENQSSLYWENQEQDKCIHIVYYKVKGNILGVNLFGIRHRHQAWEHWISNEVHIEKVLEELSVANFDPEFFKQYEKFVVDAYNSQTGKQIQIKKKKGLMGLMSILNR